MDPSWPLEIHPKLFVAAFNLRKEYPERYFCVDCGLLLKSLSSRVRDCPDTYNCCWCGVTVVFHYWRVSNHNVRCPRRPGFVTSVLRCTLQHFTPLVISPGPIVATQHNPPVDLETWDLEVSRDTKATGRVVSPTTHGRLGRRVARGGEGCFGTKRSWLYEAPKHVANA